MSDYQPKPGQAALWMGGDLSCTVHNSDGNRPQMKVRATAHRNLREGEEFEIPLWFNGDDKTRDSQPDFKGKCQDKWVPKQKQAPQQAPSQPAPAQSFDDEIPFN